MAPPWQMPKPKRRLPGRLTGNALLTAVIAAVVSGGISFGIAHWQAQDAAGQAVAGQQVSAVVQLEAAANTFYRSTGTLLGSCDKDPNLCPNGAYQSPWITDQATFNADRANVSDPRAADLAARIDDDAATAIEYGGTSRSYTYYDDMTTAYQQLIARCGQFVRGR